MKHVTLMIVFGALVVMAGSSTGPRPVEARNNYSKEFKAKYVGEAKTDAEKKLAAAIKTVKCFVCHDPNRRNAQGKKSKKFRNPYGQALAKLLPKKCKNKKLINDALDQLAAKKPAGKNITYGDRLKKGDLPFAGK